MTKAIKTLASFIVGLLLTSSAFAQTAQSPEYFQKIDQFEALTMNQMEAFFEYVDGQQGIDKETVKLLLQTLKAQRFSLHLEVIHLKNLYTKIFVDRTASKDDRKTLVSVESNLSIATHRQLTLVHDFLENGDFSEKEITKLDREIRSIAADLRIGKSISVPAKMGIGQVFQAGKRMAQNVCKLLYGFCMRKSMTEIMNSLNTADFLRSEFQYVGIDVARANLEYNQKAVFILIGNHDQPLLDITLAQNVAHKLGSDHHIVMTRKSVYPIPPSEKAGDVVFVVDNDPKSNPVQQSLDLVTKNIENSKNKIVSLAVYPEGMLPYTGGQMPMTVKEGAFIIARKLAAQYAEKGIPVYLVQMKSNVIEHLTATEEIPARLVIESVVKVPTTPLDRQRPDTWMETHRLQAENSFNSHRGNSQIDIFNSAKVPDSKIPYGMERTCSRLFIF